jgi:XTP/dITP diphosphohydrolase
MKKISKLLIGTNNKGKYKEIKDLLPNTLKHTQHLNLNLRVQREMV